VYESCSDVQACRIVAAVVKEAGWLAMEVCLIDSQGLCGVVWKLHTVLVLLRCSLQEQTDTAVGLCSMCWQASQ
jgi:hypothetical protein